MKLVVYKNDWSGKRQDLTIYQNEDMLSGRGGEIFIGRGLDCQIVLDDKKISRHHSVITNNSQGWVLKNLTQSELLLLNGQSVSSAELKQGDIIGIGQYFIEVKELDGEQDFNKTTFVPPPEKSQVQDPFKAEPSFLSEENLFDVNEESSGPEQNLSDSSSPPEDQDFEEMNSPDPFEEKNDSASFFSTENQNENKQTTEGNSFPKDDFALLPAEEDLSATSSVGESTQILEVFSNFYLKIFGEFAPFDKFKLKKERISIGRDADQCDIALSDSEVSSVHAQITRKGTFFQLEDQKSSNGTILNGERINSAYLKEGDEFIIGSTSFTFLVDAQDEVGNQQQLMPVESEQELVKEEIVEEYTDGPAGNNQDSSFAMPAAASGSFFKDPEKRKKVVYAVAFLLIAALLFVDPEEEGGSQKKKTGETTAQQTQEGGAPPAVKETPVDEETRRFLETNYQIGFAKLKQGEYADAIDSFERVRNLSPNYKDITSLYTLAKEGLEEIERLEKQRKEEIERAERMKTVNELIAKAKDAIKEEKIEMAETFFNKILELDPGNIDVGQLKLELEAMKREKERIALEKAKIEAERNRQLGLLNPGKSAYLQKEWYSAAQKLTEFLSIPDIQDDLGKEASSMLEESRKNLLATVEPLIGKARSLKEGQDLKGAYEIFLEILRIDPSNNEALGETIVIRELLTNRSKRIYREALISESLSLFEDAKEKFLEVRQISPSDSDYFKKASLKLRDYVE